MKKTLLIILSLFFVFTTAEASSRPKKEKDRWFDGPGKPKNHKARKKACEIAGAVAAGVVNNTIDEYKKSKTKHSGPDPF